MDQEQLSRAIKYLRPTAQFSFTESDYSTIKWDVLEGNAPTLEEIEAAIVTISQLDIQAEEEKRSAKESARTKLAALGLTPEEINAIS
jgi:hypothetical protein